MRNQLLSFIQKLIICIFIFFIGFFIGKQFQIKSSSDKIAKVNDDFAKEKIEYKKQLDDLTAWKENRGILIETKQYTYNKNSIGVYSPLLQDKIVEISTYKYRGEIVIKKKIEINDISRVTIWEYKTSTPLSNRIIPENFGIFDGYENYSYKASSVVDLKKRWTELYKTSQGLEMYYDYEYAPRTIGAVSLNSYFNYITYKVPFPSMLIISTNVDTFSSSDKNINSAKEQLKNIADTIDLVVE